MNIEEFNTFGNTFPLGNIWRILVNIREYSRIFGNIPFIRKHAIIILRIFPIRRIIIVAGILIVGQLSVIGRDNRMASGLGDSSYLYARPILKGVKYLRAALNTGAHGVKKGWWV